MARRINIIATREPYRDTRCALRGAFAARDTARCVCYVRRYALQRFVIMPACALFATPFRFIARVLPRAIRPLALTRFDIPFDVATFSIDAGKPVSRRADTFAITWVEDERRRRSYRHDVARYYAMPARFILPPYATIVTKRRRAMPGYMLAADRQSFHRRHHHFAIRFVLLRFATDELFFIFPR